MMTPEETAAVLRQAGARRVAVLDRRLRGIFAYFEFGGLIQVWRLRADARIDNFARDVARELGDNQQRAA